MRELTDAERLRRFMQALGQEAEREARVYFTGGATAVLMGWRATTIDADITIVPESDRILRALPALKERLRMNVELAAPSHFIPPLPGWEEGSPFIGRESKVSFHHYDLYSQALAKIERGHVQDRGDVREMLARRLVTPERIRELFEKIAPELYRYPALDPSSFRRAVDEALSSP
jgi:hypothetical protein